MLPSVLATFFSATVFHFSVFFQIVNKHNDKRQCLGNCNSHKLKFICTCSGYNMKYVDDCVIYKMVTHCHI